MYLTCGATSNINVVSLDKINYANPNIGGDGSLTFVYLGGATVKLTAPADVQDAISGLAQIQSLISLKQFPSTIA